MRGVTCGLWATRRRLIAAAVDERGVAMWIGSADRDDDGCWGLLATVDAQVKVDFELVLPEAIARADPISRIASDRGLALWVVPDALVESVRMVGRLGAGPPARTAAALARLPLARAMRAQLRRVSHTDSRQLRLL